MVENIFKIPGYELSEYLNKSVLTVRKQLFLFVAISLIVHMMPIILNVNLAGEVVEKKKPPTTVKFIQRAPRLQKQMELQKTPKIVERNMQRRVSQQRMSMMPRTMTTSSSHGGTALGSLGRPGDLVTDHFLRNSSFMVPTFQQKLLTPVPAVSRSAA